MIEEPEAMYMMTKEEFWDIVRAFNPDLSWEEYEEMWDAFQKFKRLKQIN